MQRGSRLSVRKRTGAASQSKRHRQHSRRCCLRSGTVNKCKETPLLPLIAPLLLLGGSASFPVHCLVRSGIAHSSSRQVPRSHKAETQSRPTRQTVGTLLTIPPPPQRLPRPPSGPTLLQQTKKQQFQSHPQLRRPLNSDRHRYCRRLPLAADGNALSALIRTGCLHISLTSKVPLVQRTASRSSIPHHLVPRAHHVTPHAYGTPSCCSAIWHVTPHTSKQ